MTVEEKMMSKINEMENEISLTLYRSGIDSSFALLINRYRKVLSSKRRELTSIYFEFSDEVKFASSKEEVDEIHQKYKDRLDSMK